MDPQLLAQLRQQLRQQGLNIKDDVASYAKSINLYKGRSADKADPSSSTQPANMAPKVDQQALDFDRKKQQLSKYIKQATATGMLRTFQEKFLTKINKSQTMDELREFGNDLIKVIENLQAANKAGPPQAQAATQALNTYIAQAEKTQAPPSSNMTQVASKFAADANKSIESKASSLAITQAYPNLRMYSTYSSEPVNVRVPTTEGTDRAWVLGLPLQDGTELLALGFNVRRSQGLLIADEGRPAQQLLGHLFVIQKGEQVATIEPAIKQADGTVKLGKISLPL